MRTLRAVNVVRAVRVRVRREGVRKCLSWSRSDGVDER